MALLVIIAATTDGKKVLLACESGDQESKEGWSGILRDLPDPPCAWIAAAAGLPGREQRCWNYKIGNVLDKLPKIELPAAKRQTTAPVDELRDTQKECEKQRDHFVSRYRKEYPRRRTL